MNLNKKLAILGGVFIAAAIIFCLLTYEKSNIPEQNSVEIHKPPHLVQTPVIDDRPHPPGSSPIIEPQPPTSPPKVSVIKMPGRFAESPADIKEHVQTFIDQCKILEKAHAKLYKSWDTKTTHMTLYIVEPFSDEEKSYLEGLASQKTEGFSAEIQEELEKARLDALQEFEIELNFKHLLIMAPYNAARHLGVIEGEFESLSEIPEDPAKTPFSKLLNAKSYDLPRADNNWRYSHLLQESIE